MVIQETFASPNMEVGVVYFLEVIPEYIWMIPILRYPKTDELPLDDEEARRIRKQAARYT